MKIDKTGYYPSTPGSSCDPDYRPDAADASRIAEEASPAIDAAARSAAESAPETDMPLSSGTLEPSDSERFVSGVSHLLSWILVPMLVPVWGTMLMFHASTMSMVPFVTKLIFTLVVFGFCTVVPMGAVLLLKKIGMVQDLGLNGRKERLVPYIVMIVCFVATGIFFWSKGAPRWSALFFIGGAVAAAVNMIINRWWKISAHCAGMAGIVAMLLLMIRDDQAVINMFWWLQANILLCGLLGSARVWLGRHTAGQVIAGYAVGFLAVYLTGLFL